MITKMGALKNFFIRNVDNVDKKVDRFYGKPAKCRIC